VRIADFLHCLAANMPKYFYITYHHQQAVQNDATKSKHLVTMYFSLLKLLTAFYHGRKSGPYQRLAVGVAVSGWWG